MGRRGAPRISDADRPSWPILTSSVGTLYLLADAVKLVHAPAFLDGVVLGVSASMLVLTFTIGPRRDAYERHLSEAVCVHQRDGDPPGWS
jgi:hypothetical protein